MQSKNNKTNKLFYGDNLEILRRYIEDESVDLIYLDPPFNSDQAFNIFFEEKNGGKSKAQIKAFEDTWHWDEVADKTYREIMKKSPNDVAECIKAFKEFLDEKTDMIAYLVMMTARLVELRRVLKPSGSIYLHCDPTASHYLKVIMDRIFKPQNFQNEIIWHYQTGGATKKRYSRKHDVLLFYSKGKSWTYNWEEVKMRRTEKSLKRAQIPKGARISKDDIYKNPDDVWDIPQMNPMAKERLNYPTQKPEALLEKIIRASSNKGDIICDPFCGCGTAVAVAEKLNRNWIGIDITHLAINLIKHRLKNAFGKRVKYEVTGEPKDIKGAEALAIEDRYQFQWWALGLVGARPAKSDEKKGKDTGIDGVLRFYDDPKEVKKIIIQVKSGHVGVKDIRELCDTINSQSAQIGGFIALQRPTRGMKTRAVKEGYYESKHWNKKYRKIQILTIDELLEGKQIDFPPETNITFKKAERIEKETRKQTELL